MKLTASILVLIATTPAWANTKVFPLTPAAAESEQITRALATSIDAEVSSVALEDAAGLLDCDPAKATCLETVAKSVNATELVFGTLAIEKGQARVVLTRFVVGKDPTTRTFELAGGPSEWPDELVRVSGELFGKPAPVVETPLPPVKTPPPVTESSGGVTLTTWLLIGGGVALAGVGTGFLVSASGIEEDVKSAPRNTVEDFERLVALEDKGRSRQLTGTVLLGVGGVALTVGIIRAFMQRGDPKDSAVRITPTVGNGGAALVLDVELP